MTHDYAGTPILLARRRDGSLGVSMSKWRRKCKLAC